MKTAVITTGGLGTREATITKTIPNTAPVLASIKFIEIISKFVDPVNP